MRTYKFCIFPLLVLGISSCTNSFKAISNELDKRQHIERSNLASLSFHDLRMKLFRAERLNFLKNTDSIFVLESFNVEEAAYYGKIWTGKDSIEYMYRNNEFSYNVQTPFTTYMNQLINKWDTIAIRKNENLYSKIIPIQWVYGAKIINYHNNPETYTIRFKRFFNVDRDGFSTP